MFEYFLHLLPVIWALTSALIALLLYKSSKAFFEQTESNEKGTKRVRLVGSIVIAAVVFLALRNSSLSREVSPGDLVVPQSKLDELKGALADVESASDELDVCLNMTVAGECRTQIEALRAQAARSRTAAAALQGSGRE